MIFFPFPIYYMCLILLLLLFFCLQKTQKKPRLLCGYLFIQKKIINFNQSNSEPMTMNQSINQSNHIHESFCPVIQFLHQLPYLKVLLMLKWLPKKYSVLSNWMRMISVMAIQRHVYKYIFTTNPTPKNQPSTLPSPSCL